METNVGALGAEKKFDFRLNFADGEVHCPDLGGYRPIADCAKCSALLEMDPDSLVCRPKTDRPMSDVIEDMIRVPYPGRD